jgi:hypothetical protein
MTETPKRTTSHQLIDISAKLDQVLGLLGEETEDGRGGYKATGLLGRVRRAEDKLDNIHRKYAYWLWGVSGFTSALSACLTVIWYFTKDKIAGIFQ